MADLIRVLRACNLQAVREGIVADPKAASNPRAVVETGRPAFQPALEVWVIDPELHQVRVSTPDGNAHTYRAGEQIPLRLFGSATLPVNEIFS